MKGVIVSAGLSTCHYMYRELAAVKANNAAKHSGET